MLSAILTLLVPVIMSLAFVACFSRHAQREIWDIEDNISEWYDTIIVTFDETSDDETSTDNGIDTELCAALLECGISPDQFCINPTQPNTLQRKR